MSGAHITIVYDDAQVIAALRRLGEVTDNLRPALTEIGEALSINADNRFRWTSFW